MRIHLKNSDECVRVLSVVTRHTVFSLNSYANEKVYIEFHHKHLH